MWAKLFGSLDSCTRSRLLWHMFTFASSTRKSTPTLRKGARPTSSFRHKHR